MKRLLGLLFCVGYSSCGCTEIKLANYPRPFACDRNGGDGGEQCAPGWACGYDDRCFEKDGGLDGGQHVEQWQCGNDGHCPSGWLCGQEVDSVRRCQQLGVGAPSACVNDDGGCQGGWRCDLAAQHCVQVPDQLTTGRTQALGAQELSPRRYEPPPLLFAMSRIGPLPLAFGGVGQREGVWSAALQADAGLRVQAQFVDEQPVTDGGSTPLLFERLFAVRADATDVTDLVLSIDGPVVRYRDGGAERLGLADAGWEVLGASTFLRQRDWLEGPPRPLALVRVTDREVRVDGLPLSTFPSEVAEVVALGDVSLALTAAGLFANTGPDGGPQRQLTDAGLPGTSSRGAVAGFFDGPRPLLAVYAELERDGGSGLVQFQETPMGWANTPLFAGCPDGGSPLQLSFEQDVDGSPLVFTRCADEQGGSYPVKLNASPFNQRQDFRAVIEDQRPFQWGVVSQRGSPFVRAHAGSNGRTWHAIDRGARGQLGRLSLRPVLLDRQPDMMFSFGDPGSQRSRLFAEAGGLVFIEDPAGGFVSQLGADPVVPLNVIAGHPSWLITTSGLFETLGGQGRSLAALPAGYGFSGPAAGVAFSAPVAARARTVVLVASGDSLWLADVTEAQTGPFAQPATFERVLVPVPGVRLRSMVLDGRGDGGLTGYLTTNSANLEFGTADLVRWSQSPVPTPELRALPLAVWLEPNGQGRTGFTDGVVWSLPVMVPLTAPLVAQDGGALAASDFGRKCGDLFTATTEGLYRAERSSADGGLPRWVPVSLPVALDTTESLRLFETAGRLLVGTQTGQLVEVTATCP